MGGTFLHVKTPISSDGSYQLRKIIRAHHHLQNFISAKATAEMERSPQLRKSKVRESEESHRKRSGLSRRIEEREGEREGFEGETERTRFMECSEGFSDR